jgi:hypothetical protein
VKIAEPDREFLVAEALALSEQLPFGDGRAAYQDIAWAADQGEIPDELAERVGELLALSLDTGRARSEHGPAGVRALTSIWRETPQGRRQATDLDGLNEALSALRGLPVGTVRVASSGPGAYAVTIGAGDVEMRLSLDRTGVRLRSVNVGGGGIGE